MDIYARVVAGLGGGRANGSGEESDVLSLMPGDFLEATTDPCWETSLGERVAVVLGKSLGVERVLEMLEGQRILRGWQTSKYLENKRLFYSCSNAYLEDVGVCDGGSATSGYSAGQGGGDESSDGGELHSDCGK